MRVRVAVPASVANLGPGFDILAMALQLQNDIRAEQRPGPLSVDAGPDALAALNDPEHNLVTIAYTKSCAELGIPAAGVHFACVNRIPIGRGMGSSGAAALAGVLVPRRLVQCGGHEHAGQGSGGARSHAAPDRDPVHALEVHAGGGNAELGA